MIQFQTALQQDPGYVPAHNDLGTLYAERGQFAQAIAAFRRALAIDADSIPARYNLALAYGAQESRQPCGGNCMGDAAS